MHQLDQAWLEAVRLNKLSLFFNLLFQRKMDKETIIIIIVVIIVIFAVLYTTGIISINIGKTGNSVAGRSTNGNMPQECQAPAGQDINAWKEHLGHHENTKYCLEYYN